jgi:transcriptional regulator with XRE-family HTH domain
MLPSIVTSFCNPQKMGKRRTTQVPRKITTLDIQVGKNLRIYRLAKGLPLTKVGAAIGVTFQQVQKYENGKNKISPGNLAKLAGVLGVPVEAFFGDAGQRPNGTTNKVVTDYLQQPYAIRMLRALAKVSGNKKRLAIVLLAEAMAEDR